MEGTTPVMSIQHHLRRAFSQFFKSELTFLCFNVLKRSLKNQNWN